MRRKNLELLLVGALAGATALFAWKVRDIADYLEMQYNRNAPIERVYKSCSSEKSVLKSDFERKTLPSGHTLYIVYGDHFSQDAAEHIYKEVAPEVEKNPSNWRFLIEGNLNSGSPVGPENRFAKALSERYAISVDDVIVGDYDSRVIDIVKAKGFSEDEIYSKILYTRFVVSHLVGKNNETKSRDYAVEEVARLTGKDEAYLGRLIDDYLPNRHNGNKERWEQLDTSILNARNKISQENLASVLESPSTPKNILLVVGRRHYDIVHLK